MTLKQSLLCFLFAVIIAALPLIIIENTDSIKSIEQFVFDVLQLTVQTVQTNNSNDLEKGKIIALLFILLALCYLIIYFVCFEFFIIAYLLISSKGRKPVIFISFKITDEQSKTNTTGIAETLKKALWEKGFKVNMQEPVATPIHDQLNHGIKQLMKASDALIAIPHAVHPSYVDTEIGTAYHNDKPVYIIKYTPEQKLPATANSGHIVFNLARLKKAGYKPLAEVATYIHGYWKNRLNLLLLPFKKLDPGGKFPFDMIGFYALAFIVSLLMGYINIQVAWLKIPIEILVGVLGFISALATMKHIFKSINLQHAARQSAINDEPTHHLLEQAGFNKNVMEAIDKKGLKQ